MKFDIDKIFEETRRTAQAYSESVTSKKDMEAVYFSFNLRTVKVQLCLVHVHYICK